MAGPYYVDVTTGNDGDDGLSEVNAFATLEHAAGVIAAGEIVYVKASANYVVEDGANDCCLLVETVGAVATPILWQGYHTTINDGGIVTIDANTNTLANCVRTDSLAATYNVFKNFRFTGASGVGFAGGTDDFMTFKNCRADNNGTHGFEVDNYCGFENISADNNGTTTAHHGITADFSTSVIGVVAYANAGRGIDIQYGPVAFVLCYNNGNCPNIHCIADPTAVINCTIDGEAGNVSLGIQNTSVAAPFAVVNCILHDLNEGVKTDTATGELNIARNNLYNSNTADVANFLAPSAGNGVGNRGDVEDTPDFTNEGGDDYTIAAAGNPLAAGFDAKFVDDFWDSFNGATNPPSP